MMQMHWRAGVGREPCGAPLRRAARCAGRRLRHPAPPRCVLLQVVFRVGLVLLASAQEQLLGMPFEKLVAALNARRFPVLERHPDALMRVRG